MHHREPGCGDTRESRFISTSAGRVEILQDGEQDDGSWS
jgi:hypothetical protein